MWESEFGPRTQPCLSFTHRQTERELVKPSFQIGALLCSSTMFSTSLRFHRSIRPSPSCAHTDTDTHTHVKVPTGNPGCAKSPLIRLNTCLNDASKSKTHSSLRYWAGYMYLHVHVAIGSTITISLRNQPSRPTQPGHPSVGRCNEYWRWLWSLLGKKMVSSA